MAMNTCTLLSSLGHQIDIVFTGGLKHSKFQCIRQVPDISVLEEPNFHFGVDFFLFLIAR